MAEQANSDFRSEQHRHFGGLHRPRAQSAGGALGGAPADRLGAGQGLATAVDVIPIVTLHLSFALGDHHAAEAVPGAGVTTDETVAVTVYPAALVGIQGGAVGLGHPLVGGERRCLASQGTFHGLLGTQAPWMIEVQLGQLAGHQRGIGETGAFVLGGMAGDRQRRRHRLADGRLAGRRGARRALALACVEGDAETLVTVELDGFHLALAHAGGQALLQRHRHFAGTGALAAGLGDDLLDLLAKVRKHGGTDCRGM
ncbi:hypothetical protein PALA42_01640 [Pseudomonas aeruginosa]|nr:hypothetical protein PALA42_01640 [Pseudomonas aeruginosa]